VIIVLDRFLLRDTMLVYAIVMCLSLSICLSVCLSVTSQCSTEIAKLESCKQCLTIAQGHSLLIPKISEKFKWGHFKQGDKQVG